MNSVTLDWHDEDNRDSYKLCMKEYGLECLQAIVIDDDTVEITVYGSNEDLDTFLEDYEEDCLLPLEPMSQSLEFDEDYEGWLNNEIYAIDNETEVEATDHYDDIVIDHIEI